MIPLETHKRVLVVDDEATIRELVAEALTDSGYDVKTAANGAVALNILQDWVPHAIVLDLMMPRLDGMSFVELLRLNSDLAKVPVVLVTATYAAEEVADRIGARALLTKPFELDELVARVTDLIGAPPLALPFEIDSEERYGLPCESA